MKPSAHPLLAVWLLTAALGAGAQTEKLAAVASASLPPAGESNKHYVSNRAPLSSSPLVKLPIGAVEPKGWLLGPASAHAGPASRAGLRS